MTTAFQILAYPERAFGGYSRFDPTVELYSRIRAVMRPSDVVLDIGCGRGQHTEDTSLYRAKLRNVKGDCGRVIGIDVDNAGEDNSTIDEFRSITDIDSWPVDDESIDVAFADYVLEHVQDPSKFFSEVRRVLKPGGYFAARTPNRFHYVCLFAQLIPNRFHARVVSLIQRGRKEEDIFPTVYRANSKSKLKRLMRHEGFACSVYRSETAPNYMAFSPTLYRIGAVVHQYMPPVLQSTLLAFGRKPPQT